MEALVDMEASPKAGQTVEPRRDMHRPSDWATARAGRVMRRESKVRVGDERGGEVGSAAGLLLAFVRGGSGQASE